MITHDYQNFLYKIVCHLDKFWKEHDRQIKKNVCKKVYLGSFFIPEKYVISALCESMDEPDTPSCNSSGPPGFLSILSYSKVKPILDLTFET